MPRFARTGLSAKISLPLAPMIAIMFQMLLFFLLNLKLVAPERNVGVPMPIGAPIAARADASRTSDIKVRLLADDQGNLVQILMGENRLGHDDRAFERLNSEILQRIGRPGAARTDDVQVEIDADYDLRYEYVLQAVSQCSGRLDSRGNMIRYVEKIKFAPPHKKQDEG